MGQREGGVKKEKGDQEKKREVAYNIISGK